MTLSTPSEAAVQATAAYFLATGWAADCDDLEDPAAICENDARLALEAALPHLIDDAMIERAAAVLDEVLPERQFSQEGVRELAEDVLRKALGGDDG